MKPIHKIRFICLLLLKRSSATSVPSRSVCAGNWLIENVPLVFLLNLLAKFPDESAAVIAVRHDHDAIALHAMSDHVALKAPVTTAVHEVPALALLFDAKTDGVWSNTYTRHHLLHRGLRQYAI